MSNINKRPYRADGGDISTDRLKEIADNPYGDEEKCWLAKRVLASLEAEPVAWIVHARTGDQLTADGGYVANAEGILGLHSTPLYTTPPAPVSVPTFDEWLEIRGTKPLGWVKDAMRESYDACRAAMLQGADGTLTNEGTIPGGNSPVIPDGWVLVPVEPTYQMCKAMELPWESPRFPDLYKAMLAAVKK